MVDFQERDTTRGLHTEDEEEPEPEEPDAEPDSDEIEDHKHDHVEHGHEHHAHDLEQIRFGVVTVSTSRTLDSDPSGDAIQEAVEREGHEVVIRELVGDRLDAVQSIVNRLVGRKDVDIVISTGGTGVSPDDVTIEAIEPLLDKDLPGFGELFRRRSEGDIGTKIIATRATAGISDGVPVFALPGSVAAVELGVEDVILPQAGHLAGLAQRHTDEE